MKLAWDFLWHDQSAASWIANLVVAFLVIRFIVYPVLGLVFGTAFPIVAVVSESMEHTTTNGVVCGMKLDEFRESFESWWETCGAYYEERGISEAQFRDFPLSNGFYKGDVIILWRAHRDNLEVGDVLVFAGTRPQPIIHRIVDVWEEEGEVFYQTKGDHNSRSIGGGFGEEKISEERLLGQGVVRIPYLGWLKILFVDAVAPLGIVIER